jgi:hypothetical protein
MGPHTYHTREAHSRRPPGVITAALANEPLTPAISSISRHLVSWTAHLSPSLRATPAALAMTGPTGSMSRAVAGLYVERHVLIRSYFLGLGFTVLNMIPRAILNLSPLGASVVSIVAVLAISWTAWCVLMHSYFVCSTKSRGVPH